MTRFTNHDLWDGDIITPATYPGTLNATTVESKICILVSRSIKYVVHCLLDCRMLLVEGNGYLKMEASGL
jgi:hypothetical protein